LHAYVIMPNHFHAICSQADGQLSAVIRDLKKFTAREIARKLEEDGRNTWLSAMRRAAGGGGVKVWDEAFHPEQIHSKPFLEQKLAYLHNNPSRAGYVSDPCEWKHSSAGLYYRDSQPLVPIVPLEL
jgi:REP element-mobilizing transposase RayT